MKQAFKNIVTSAESSPGLATTSLEGLLEQLNEALEAEIKLIEQALTAIAEAEAALEEAKV